MQLPIRLVIGFGFMVHGWAKLSRGPAGFARLLHQIGVPAPLFTAWTATLLEIVGGAAILIGALVAYVSIPLIAMMAVAMFTIHARYGFSSINTIGLMPTGPRFGPPGYEINLLYIAGLLALMFGGPGALSIDAWRDRSRGGEAVMRASPRVPFLARVPSVDRRIELLGVVGLAVLRYGLVFLLLLWGTFKFFAFEANGIQPLVQNSPFLSWLYPLLGVQGASSFIGVMEIVTALLIALRRWRPVASAYGSLLAAATFATTLSFLVTTPGALVTGSPLGGFLMKDLLFLGAALFTSAEAFRAARGCLIE